MTSALPYIHGVPHLGNMAAFIPADIFHRYLDVRGVKNEYIWGSDVHGTPTELEAMERGEDVEEMMQEQHEKVKKVADRFDMDYSIYSHTHSDHNRKQTHDMFVELYCNGYIEEKEQNLPYCRNDERFLPDRYIEGECPHCGGLARGDQCDDCGKLVEPEELVEPECQICGESDIDFRDTTHLFLDLPQFKDEIGEWLDRADPQPVPDSSLKEVENTLEETEPRCITRDIDWGFEIPVDRVNRRIEEEDLDVPELDEDVYGEKVLYVWFDAPIGYIGFTREMFDDGEEWKEHWCGENTEVYYSIGKDNTIFHSIIWPSMLIGSRTEDREYNLPHYEFIQQFLLAEDTKFSKSRGKGLSTEEALDMYPTDYWRFYLSRNLPQEHDTTFSWSDFEKEINNVLNDTVGNFVNRTVSLAEKWFDSEVPDPEFTERDEEVLAEAEELLREYEREFEDHNLKAGLEKALELARLGDRYLSEEEPWNSEDRREEVIHVALQITADLSTVLYPFIPSSAERTAEMLKTGIDTSEGYDMLKNPARLEPGQEIGEKEILFEKIDTSDRQEEQEEEEEDEISFEEFQEMNLRVGEVREVEDHPNADRLYRVQVDVGGEVLQTCAGLVDHYGKEELEGRKVVVLANLEESELRGEKSECMMLAAEDDEGNVSLLETDTEIDAGSEIK
ncbi:MAG: methionine--tRNA ligase [Candidatus Nanohaloarchaea archaeon]